MAKILTILLLLSIFVGLILLAVAGWRRRIREQQQGIEAPAESFVGSGGVALEAPALASAAIQYVATTIKDEPLNRVNAHGLGFRGKATLEVSKLGLLIKRRGERNVALSNEQITNIEFVQATIDRVVEKDGLVAIHWRQNRTDLTTVLRFNSAADRNSVLRASEDLARKANS